MWVCVFLCAVFVNIYDKPHRLGFSPFHYLLLFIMSVQLSLMVTATFLTYLCTHKPSNVYFICISKHIFIGEDMMGGEKKFHVYFMPDLFITRGVDPIFSEKWQKSQRLQKNRETERFDRSKGFESLLYYFQRCAASLACLFALSVHVWFSVCGERGECLHVCLLHAASRGYPSPPCDFMLVGICHAYGADNRAHWS